MKVLTSEAFPRRSQQCDHGARVTLRFKSDRKQALLALAVQLRVGGELYPFYAAPGFHRFLQCNIFLTRGHKVESWGLNTALISILFCNTMGFLEMELAVSQTRHGPSCPATIPPILTNLTQPGQCHILMSPP